VAYSSSNHKRIDKYVRGDKDGGIHFGDDDNGADVQHSIDQANEVRNEMYVTVEVLPPLKHP
jgi:hypothetical protein